MKYTENACKEILSFILKISDYFLEEKQIIVSDIAELINFLKNPDGKKINGNLILKFSSQNRLENGTVIKMEETIRFDKNGFTIKTFSQEDFFGEYNTNNEFRVDEDESEEFLSKYINETMETVFIILEENKGKSEIVTNRFQVK